jgi:hypothetical protein
MPEFVMADESCPDWDYFYEKSLGCIGLLKLWLVRACSLALREGAKTITFDHLERRAHSVKALTKLLAEIKDGESELDETEGERQLLRNNLGLEGPARKKSSSSQMQVSKPEAKSGRDDSKSGRKTRRNRPGRRNPVRDKVGDRAA